jgi:hypothetical protein
MQTDFFTSSYGNIQQARWRRYGKVLDMLDALCDARLAASLRRALLASATMPSQRILLAAVRVPGREKALEDLIQMLGRATRHQVTSAIVPMGERGKFDNINLAVAGHDLSQFDWVLILDDDIAVPDHFLDLFVYFCHRERLQLAMPAHRFLSHKIFAVTERHWGSGVRRTAFVEIGPLTLLHATLFAQVMPFPSLRFAWGLDVFWSSEAWRLGWRLGVVDATPIRHLRPVGQSYSGALAMEEASRFLEARNVTLTRAEIFRPDEKIF